MEKSVTQKMNKNWTNKGGHSNIYKEHKKCIQVNSNFCLLFRLLLLVRHILMRIFKGSRTLRVFAFLWFLVWFFFKFIFFFVYANSNSSPDLGISNISAKSGGSLSRVQLLLNHCKWSACLEPSERSSGSFMIRVEKMCTSLLWLRPICNFNASKSFSWLWCIAFTSYIPPLSVND